MGEIGYIYEIRPEGLGYAVVARHKAADLPSTAIDCPILADYKAGAGISDDHVPVTETIAGAIVDFFAADAQKLLVGEVLVGEIDAVEVQRIRDDRDGRIARTVLLGQVI